MAFSSHSCGDAVSPAQAGRRLFMRVPMIVLAAAAVGLGSTASAGPLQGFRCTRVPLVWPLTAPMRVLRKMTCGEITRHPPDRAELEMVQNLRAYYLIRGVIIQVVQEDAASGMSEVHLPGGFRTFWTLTRFLSRSTHQRYLGSGGNAHNVEYDAPRANGVDAQCNPKGRCWCFEPARCNAEAEVVENRSLNSCVLEHIIRSAGPNFDTPLLTLVAGISPRSR